ncbi:MAG: HEXXH motif-containing putative peptide modification protein [Deltaproteobacteria bacterium]|nr:HEXXH motif-containing putative peptide modification protein [Deltaproteobacteria bacterium]
MVEVAALARALPSLGAARPDITAFLDGYAELARLPASVVAQVMGKPHGFAWLRRCFECADVLAGRCQPSSVAHHWLPGQDLTTFTHEVLGRTGVFAVAAGLLSSTLVELRSPVPILRPMTLPGTGLHLRPVEPGAALLGCDAAPRVRGCRVVRLADVPAGDHTVIVDPFDAWLTLEAGATNIIAARDDAALGRFRTLLGEALALFASHLPSVLDEITLTYDSVAPTTFGGPSGFPSGTTSSSVGYSVFAVPPSASVLCEMLVHEVSHSHLFVVQDIDPLLDPRHHGSGWMPEALYSPWRDDPRPLNGLLHAAFVFARVARFWMRIYACGIDADRELAQRRLAALRLQLGVVSETLGRQAHWTEAGHGFYLLLRGEIAAIRAETASFGLDGAVPCYAEDASTGLAVGSARDRQRSHFAAWRRRNLELDPGAAGDVAHSLEVP